MSRRHAAHAAPRSASAPAPHGRTHPLLLPLIGVLVLHVIGFGLLLLSVVPADLRLSSGELFGVGVGLTAYTLGMRHAFDADHIAAIDNTTRKLLHDGRRPHATGFFFSAGHSTVVFVLTLLVALGARGVGAAVQDDGSTLHEVTAVWGPSVAGVFLLTIAVVNLGVVRQTLGLARRASAGQLRTTDLDDQQLTGRGPISRLTRSIAGKVTRPWQMYPVGLMFGFGFDTATEIALLVLAGGGAASGLPVSAILCLPILFAAGMTLLDTLNGATTARAYAWAMNAPARRVAYNVAVTGISVVFAFVIGALSLLGVAVDEFGIGGPLATVASIDTGLLGYALLATILVAWTTAALWARSVERRWA